MPHPPRLLGSFLAACAMSLIAGCGGASVEEPATLASIQITPAAASRAVGLTQAYTATAVDSKGVTGDVTREVSWASSTPAAAGIDATGVASTAAVGSTTITASLGGITSNSAILTVSASTPVPVVASPPGSWVPPIGIPEPGFGVRETHFMYRLANGEDCNTAPNKCFNFGNGLEPYKDGGDGPYSHYVDNTIAASTDNSNPFGSPLKPRKTVPMNISAGSVVEIHHGYDSNGFGEAGFTGVGTIDKPIFFRGIGLPRFNGMMDFGYYGSTQYAIVEGLDFTTFFILGRQNGVSFVNNHLAVRYCDIHDGGGSSGITSYTSNPLHDVVMLSNKIHDHGEWDPEKAVGDQDFHGIGIGAVSNIWILDNEMYHNSGDGVQINGSRESTHHIYIGRNTAHHNKQSGFWTKTASDVVFSQNSSYGHRVSSSSGGPGLGFQYDPMRVWFLYNIAWDNDHGMANGSSNLGGGDDINFIGNVLRNNRVAGLTLNGTKFPRPVEVIANTITGSPTGILNGYYSVKAHIANNIIEATGKQINLDADYRSDEYSTIDTNLFGLPLSVKWGYTSYNSLSAFQASTGKCADCLVANAKFVDPANADLRLQSSSPAVNSAKDADIYDRFRTLYGLDIRKDVRGNQRPAGGAWDMGAYEFGP